jgi:hypothetical protein
MTTLGQCRDDLGSLRATSSSPEAACIDLLLSRISDWSEDDTTVDVLVSDLDRLIGELGFSTREARARVALAVARLHDTIDRVGGMTMNERLFSFDLLDRWDRSSDEQRGVLCQKVLARR